MIVVDSSVWIAAFGSNACTEAVVLAQLLDADEVALAAPVRVELLSGASRSDLPKLRRALSALPILYPGDETWSIIDHWIDKACARGLRFGVGDLLVAALASEAGSLVWSLDSDFDRMRRAGFVELYEP